jgi:tRNA(fMet)-specific endonuclease VapC
MCRTNSSPIAISRRKSGTCSRWRFATCTNTVSHIVKGNIPQVRERLVKVPMAEVGISVVTEAELRFGVARRPEATNLKMAVEQFLLRVEVLPWDSDCAQHYARIGAELERQGIPIGNLDMMIAAQALAASTVLVSSDRVFGRVKALKIQDWSTL